MKAKKPQPKKAVKKAVKIVKEEFDNTVIVPLGFNAKFETQMDSFLHAEKLAHERYLQAKAQVRDYSEHLKRELEKAK